LGCAGNNAGLTVITPFVDAMLSQAGWPVNVQVIAVVAPLVAVKM